MSVLDNFSNWKNFLNERVDQAQKMGMNNETISNLAYQIGDYLAAQVDPKNNEERLLKELWDASNEEQQKTLAQVMVNMVDKKQ
ncbi:DUF3243 domain-containing protein [Tepidibacillus infernus]|uniref:DUF3243 domain-containing protein n=1 Tax=Tepidibacillus decaturensis TaxID=1413211 RepID=A0A135L3C5_9BACI|nr:MULTISPECIES: DUF3243 domain-containing protein [Tepidibacillus]KXG43451.1 hypothetical protein U473_05070 [Tepidibacillus decaturensis]GBF11315.1 hypothetical protein HK1_01339 [Tepidibacillus sp. HK-1]